MTATAYDYCMEQVAKRANNPCNNTEAVSFIKTHLADATKLANQLGIPVQFVLAVSGAESTYGTSPAATSDNNYFGIHWGDGGPAAYGASQSTRNPILAAWPSGTDGFLGSGNVFAAIAAGDNAANQTNAAQFFTDIHKQYGVGTASYVANMVQVAASVIGRLNCP
jgi:membrane-bound lytic murein transglycosylase B